MAKPILDSRARTGYPAFMEAANENLHSVLVVSGSSKSAEAICSALAGTDFTPVACCNSGQEALRLLNQTPYPLVILNIPLPDVAAAAFARELAGDPARGVLLLVPSAAYDETCAHVERFGVLTLAKPVNARILLQGLHLLVATQNRLAQLERKTHTLETKIEDIRIINRAKWVLIEQLKMDEDSAHHYIEKQAMNQHRSRREVAQSILVTYESY